MQQVAQQQKKQSLSTQVSELEDTLDSILTSPSFSVAWYLNTALNSSDDNRNSTNSSVKKALTKSTAISAASNRNVGRGDFNEGEYEDEQQRMAELALQLQLQTQSCHEEIGKIGIELQAILPRCAADVNRVSIGLNGLKMDAEQLLNDSSGITKTGPTTASKATTLQSSSSIDESKNAEGNDGDLKSLESTTTGSESKKDSAVIPSYYSSMETLSTLHALQANLTRTREILMAAATWDTTVSSIAPLLANAAQNPAGLSQAVQCLIQLEHGEKALRGMPNPEERLESIQKIRNQVSSLLQPQLKAALASMNSSSSSNKLTSLQQCVQLYGQLDQMDIMKTEYIKQRPVVSGIHKLWFDFVPNSSPTFEEWLPNWFDAVLMLITEERRHSTTIFGCNKVNMEIVPEVVIRVFAECFRPILPSFKSRLETLYSSSVTVSSNTGNTSHAAEPTALKDRGSLMHISNIYESMLRFLSLVYESITGGWLDMVESGSIQLVSQIQDQEKTIINNAPTLYRELTKVFVQVATPFAIYQKNLAQLETKFLGGEARVLSQAIQRELAFISDTNNNIAVGWETLQAGVMDNLVKLADSIIPIAEGAVARFELLNGGYNVLSVLHVIDRTLGAHASELALALHKMSYLTTPATNAVDKATPSITFDDSHVLCALQVLKVGGTFQRAMKSLKSKTRERLQLLMERMLAYVSHEKLLDEAFQKLQVGGKVSFQLPETISIVEIDSLLTKAVLYDSSLDAANSSLSVLQRLATSKDDDGVITNTLYPEGNECSNRLITSCQTFVFDVCFAVPRYHLAGLSSLPAWKEKSSIIESWSTSSYGTLPQPFITHVGEHMLALVQALEPFASDHEALNLSNEIFSGELKNDSLRRVAYPFWLDFIAAATGTAGTQSLAQTLMDGKDLIDFVVGAVPVEEDDNDEEGNNETDEQSKASTAFCNMWLDVVALAVTGRLLEQVMRIPSLTTKGCEHLNTDLGYIVNVLSALGISGHPHPLLGHIAEICMLDQDVISERLNSLDRTNPSSGFLLAVEERLSAMRGLK